MFLWPELLLGSIQYHFSYGKAFIDSQKTRERLVDRGVADTSPQVLLLRTPTAPPQALQQHQKPPAPPSQNPPWTDETAGRAKAKARRIQISSDGGKEIPLSLPSHPSKNPKEERRRRIERAELNGQRTLYW